MTSSMPVLGYLITPGLLALGAALAAVPILIHLLSRRRVRKVRWAAMDWLMAAMKRHQRRLRLENWLILLLRVAAIVLLGLALARPVLTDASILPIGSKRNVYLVLDNSFSTEAKLDARSVFETVRYEADLVLRSIGPDDAAAVLVTNDPDEEATNGLMPHVLLGRTVGTEGASRAREAVAALRTRHAPANWTNTLERLQEQMADEDVNRHVIIVTDLQAKDWLRPPRERIAASEGETPDTTDTDRLKEHLISILRRPAQVRIINVGGRDRRDLAITRIENRSEQDPFVGRPLRLAVSVANYSPEVVRNAQIEVMVDGEERKRITRMPDIPAASADLRVPKPGVETVEVDLPKATFQTPGSHTIKVVVTPPRSDPGADTLGLSSERYLSLRVRRRVHVLAFSQTSRSEQQMEAEQYLRGVFEGATPLEDSGPFEGLPPIYAYESAHSDSALLSLLRARGRQPVDLVVLANRVPRDERLLKTLREFVRDGGGLLVFTGDQVTHDTLNTAFHTDDPANRLLPFAYGNAQVRERTGEKANAFGLDLEFQENPHPIAEPFTNVDADDWIKRMPPVIWGRMPFIEPSPAEGGTDGGGEEPGQAQDGEVVLRFLRDVGDAGESKLGPPAVVSSRFGEGRTVWVATSLDNGWLSTSVLFLPVLLEESAMYLTRPADAGRNLEVGGVLRASVPAEAQRVRFAMPDGGEVSPSRLTPEGSDAGRAVYRHGDVGRAGIWNLTYEVPTASGEPAKVTEAFAVNPDAAEGNLGAATEKDLRDGIPPELDLKLLPSYSDLGTELEEAREGEISRYILWAVLGVLLLESFLALRFGRRRTASDTGS